MLLLSDILNHINPIHFYGDTSLEINGFKSLTDEEVEKRDISWCSDRNVEYLKKVRVGTLVVSEIGMEYAKKMSSFNEANWIVVENPKSAFASILKLYFQQQQVYGVDESASIHENVRYNKENVFIGKNVVIEKNCQIGDSVIIDHNTVIKHGTIIKDHVKIGSNCTIGGVGFGYGKKVSGDYELTPHIGNVILNNKVEIGNNTCVDRAVMGSTILHENVKVDNLVHIAHGVHIGKNSLIIANSMIAGGVKIGENVWVAPSVSTMQKLQIGSNSTVGLGAVVLKDVDEGEIVVGNPAKLLKKK